MNTQFWVVQAFNGISYGALLFLVGSGLSLIFGVMRIVNLSHGSYFLLGGYIALSVIHATGSWALSLPVAALAIGLGVLAALAAVRGHFIGNGWSPFILVAAVVALGFFFILARVSIVPVETDVLRQLLLTVGSAFLFQQGPL